MTWNLPRPDLAYKEWLRVLKPGGRLYNFDADWYGHLYNEEKRSGYEKDRQQTEEQNVEDYYSGTGHREDGRDRAPGSAEPLRASEMGSGNDAKDRISGCFL